jgi:uncharacterized protein (DUF433 family)
MVSVHAEQRGGVFYISGTRITLDSIVYAFREGCSPESIREDFDGLSLAHVYGANRLLSGPPSRDRLLPVAAQGPVGRTGAPRHAAKFGFARPH